MMLGGSCEDPNLLNPDPNIGVLVNPDPNSDNQIMKNFLSKILTNLDQNYNTIILGHKKDFQVHRKPPTLQREHIALQNIKFRI